MFNLDRKSIPTSPGVYIYKDDRENVIYVGKAKNLRNRVSSYFSQDHKTSPKTRMLVRKIDDVEFFIVDNEVEALLLENKLIKKHSPKYNISLKDGKTYAYLKITNDEYPKLVSTRRVTDKGEYFGPFVDGYTRILLFQLTVKIFKILTNKTFSSKSRLYFDIGIAPAPSLEELDKEEYLKQVEEAKKFLRGKSTTKVLTKLKQELSEASELQKYELAMEKKKQIEAIEFLKERQKVDLVKDYDQNVVALITDQEKNKALIQVLKIKRGVISGKKEYRFDFEEDLFESFLKMFYSQQYVPKEIVVNKVFWEDEESKTALEQYLSKKRGSKVILSYPKIGEKKALVKLAEKNAELNFGEQDVLLQIQKKLKLPKTPHVIECFDMSNFGYDYLVGGMTRWVDGRPDKNGYRKFEIKSFKGKNDDYKAMQEVVYRRYRKLKEENLEMPDLIIIDGGKGQLSAACESLNKLQLELPIISLAKKEEEIFFPGESDSLQLPKNSREMLLIRDIRNSVHNFVVEYNKKKRQMRLK